MRDRDNVLVMFKVIMTFGFVIMVAELMAYHDLSTFACYVFYVIFAPVSYIFIKRKVGENER
jgi:Ca2+/Na+ antiporter